MNDASIRLISLVIGYGFGCLQFAYIVGRLAKNIDIREHGSGNAGMTNVTRTLGKKYGALVFVLDVLKAMVAFGLVTWMFGAYSVYGELFGGQVFGIIQTACECGEVHAASAVFGGSSTIGLYGALGAILGHNFPFFMKFRGGKGASCTAGAIIAFDLRIAAVLFVISLLTLIITKYVSVTSMVFALLFPVLIGVGYAVGFGYSIEMIVLAGVICLLCWVQHRENIGRLVSGTERKIGKKREAEKR